VRSALKHDIAAELTRRNVRTARGGDWSAENVRSLLLRVAAPEA
jgi:hypothetical protein